MPAQPPLLHVRPPRRRRWVWLLTVLLVLAVAAGALLLGPSLFARSPWSVAQGPVRSPAAAATTRLPPTADPPSAPGGDRPHPTTAQQALAMVEVRERTATPGYDRRLFNVNGFDFDRNGCDARNDMLRRDLKDPVIKPGSNGCRVESGVLHDRYSGESVPVRRDQVEIDHIVPLGNAWVSGAVSWAVEKRQEFANDPLNLVATQPHLNRAKADHDAAGWLPPHAPARCPYVARQLAVKWRYGLAASPGEHAAMGEVLRACPAAPLPNGSESPLDPHIGQPVAPRPVPPGSGPPPATPPDITERPTATDVSPGAFCSPEGAAGLSRTGAPMRCTQLASETRARWRTA